MRCPKCGNGKDRVVDSRNIKGGESIRRRRECLACRHRFTTYETVARMNLRVIKRNGTTEDFSRDKLRRGVEFACTRSGASPEDIDNIVDMVVSSLQSEFDGEVPSTAIGRSVMEQLYKLNPVAFVRFASVYHRYSDLQDYLNEVEGLIGKEL